MEKRGKRLQTRAALRSLPQYKDLPEEEFDEIYADHFASAEKGKAWEERTRKEIEEYQKAYDLDDLMPNDLATLRGLVQASLRLDDYEYTLNSLTAKGVSIDNLRVVEVLNKLCNDLRTSISQMQADLKITRKNRKSEAEQTVISALDTLKRKAKVFYEQKMLYIYCPKCHALLATVWLKNWGSKQNKFFLTCDNVVDGVACQQDVHVSFAYLYEKKMSSNIPELMPEGMR